MSAAALLAVKPASERRGYRCRDGRQYLPLRHLSAHPQGDSSSRAAARAGPRFLKVPTRHRPRTQRAPIEQRGALRRRAPRFLPPHGAARRRSGAGDDRARLRWTPGARAAVSSSAGAAGAVARTELNAWLKIGADDSITVLVDRSEMGQGVYTALPMLLAEELEVDFRPSGSSRLRPAMPMSTPATAVRSPAPATAYRCLGEAAHGGRASAHHADRRGRRADGASIRPSAAARAADGSRMTAARASPTAARAGGREAPVPKDVKLKRRAEFHADRHARSRGSIRRAKWTAAPSSVWT